MVILGSVVAGNGCHSLESTALIEDPESGAPTVQELGETRLFLEVVSPLPGWIAANQAKRMVWQNENYKQDLKRGFQVFEIPAVFKPSLAEFLADPEQSRRASPFVDIQVRERQKITLRKRHQVTTRGPLSRKARNKIQELAVWSWWRWKPDKVTVGDEAITIVAVDLVDSNGVFSELDGHLDDDGRMRVPLSPFMEHAVRAGIGLHLRLTCPALDLSTDVFIDHVTLLHFQKNFSNQLGATGGV